MLSHTLWIKYVRIIYFYFVRSEITTICKARSNYHRFSEKKVRSQQHRFVIKPCSNQVYVWTCMHLCMSPGRYMHIHGHDDILERGFLCIKARDFRTWRALKFIFPRNMEPEYSHRVQSACIHLHAIYQSTEFNRYFLLKRLPKNHFLCRILHKRSHMLCSQQGLRTKCMAMVTLIVYEVRVYVYNLYFDDILVLQK